MGSTRTGEPGLVFLRADSTFFNHKVVAVARGAGARFSVTARMNASVKAAIATIEESGWTKLRHTAASLAIASGADVKFVQQMLGHSSATMTLDTYGHLFEDRLDEVGDALDAARAAAQQRRNALRALPV